MSGQPPEKLVCTRLFLVLNTKWERVFFPFYAQDSHSELSFSNIQSSLTRFLNKYCFNYCGVTSWKYASDSVLTEKLNLQEAAVAGGGIIQDRSRI